MFYKILIITIVLVALSLLLFGIKMLFVKDAGFPSHSCSSIDDKTENPGACSVCDLKEISNCRE